ADDRLDAVGAGLGPELIGAEDVAVVRGGDGRHVHLRGALEQLVDARGAVQHRVLGVDMQVREARLRARGWGARGSCDGRDGGLLGTHGGGLGGHRPHLKGAYRRCSACRLSWRRVSRPRCCAPRSRRPVQVPTSRTCLRNVARSGRNGPHFSDMSGKWGREVGRGGAAAGRARRRHTGGSQARGKRAITSQEPPTSGRPTMTWTSVTRFWTGSAGWTCRSTARSVSGAASCPTVRCGTTSSWAPSYGGCSGNA